MNIGSVYSELKNNIICKIIVYGLLSALVLIPMCVQLLYSVAAVDSGYYLSLSNRIYEGYRLYNDVSCGYTPLHMYICAAFRYLFDIPYNLYWPYLLLQQVFRIGCACFVYGIARQINATKWWAFIAAYYCLFMLVRVEGTAVLLEVPSAFWGLAAAYFTLKNRNGIFLNYLWVGILVACSFLTKQYGLGFLPLVLYLIIVYFGKKEWLLPSIFVLIGFMIPLIIVFSYFGHNFMGVIFSSYGTQSAMDAGLSWTIGDRLQSVVLALFNCCKTSSAITILAVCLFPIACIHGVWKNWLFALLGFVGFSLQFYFINSSGGHYLLYMFPFVGIMIACVVSLDYNKLCKSIAYICVCYMFVWQGYLMYMKYMPYWLKDRTEINYINEVTTFCNEHIPAKSIVWIEPIYLIAVYFYADILPPNIESIGYSFGPLGLDRQEALNQIESAEYIILQTKGNSSYNFLPELLEVCKQYDSTTISGSLTLYTKH